MPHTIFFSYARADRVDPLLQRFYEDLRREVATRGGLREDSVGFVDDGVVTGADWVRDIATALQDVITPAAAALGADSPRILKLRERRAAMLVLSGDFRRALPEFDALTDAYTRTAGPASTDALQCLRQAAHCRAGLGQATTALRQFRQVLDQVRLTGGDVSPTAVDLRRNIGMLLLSDGRTAEALTELQQPHDDLHLVDPDHEDIEEIGSVLARHRLAGG